MSEPADQPSTDPPQQPPATPTAEPANLSALTGDDLLAALADDFAMRLRGGERATVEEYVAKYPELEHRIRKVLPSIALIEESRTFESPSVTEGTGSTLGRYKLLERIGEGGFGVVYMAEQLTPVRRKVALKVIKPGVDTRQVIARFEAERQALALMDHENIARVLDAGATDSGRPYFVMDLVYGVPITEYCDKNQLPPRERLELFVQVCRAVQHAHTKGIIHRDIKPTNVLVTLHEGVAVPKVIDFGVAKATGQQLTEKTLFTHFAQMVGTPLYMSPEQAEMTGIDVDTRSDVYSLGVLLYELLTGTTPLDKDRFKQAAFDEVRRIIREEEPPRPSTRLSTADALASISAQRRTEPAKLTRLVRGELDWIVMKALEKDRSRRYETASSLAADLMRHLSGEAVLAGPVSARYRLKKFVTRYRKYTLIACGLILVGLGTGALLNAELVIGVLAIVVSVIFTTAVWALYRKARQAEKIAAARRAEAESAREVAESSRSAEVEARTLAEANQARAAAEAAKAMTVSDFLQQMLRSANPDDLKGVDYTVRQMLDDFSDSLGTKLANQPEAEADLQATIGAAYRRLDNREKAEPHLARALALRRRVLGPQHEKVADSLVDCAWILHDQRRWAEAEVPLREALAIYRIHGAAGGPVIRALRALQVMLGRQWRSAESEVVADEALAIARQSPDIEFPEIANIYHSLSDTRRQRSDYVEAERLARESVSMHIRLHGPEHPETGWGYWSLSKALEAQRRFPEALAMGERVLAIFRKTYAADHQSVAIWLRHITQLLRSASDSFALAVLFPSLEKLTELESIYRQAMATNVTRAIDAGDAALTAAQGLAGFVGIYVKLSRELGTAGKTEKAETACQRGMTLLEELRTKSTARPDLLGATYLGLVESLLDLGRGDEANEYARKLLELNFSNADSLARLAWRLATSADSAHRALPLSVELAKRAVELSPRDGNYWMALGVSRYRGGDLKQSVADLEKSREFKDGGSWVFFSLAMAHRRLGNDQEACRWHDLAIEWMEKNAPVNEELTRFRDEAAELLGINEKDQPSPSTSPATTVVPSRLSAL